MTSEIFSILKAQMSLHPFFLLTVLFELTRELELVVQQRFSLALRSTVLSLESVDKTDLLLRKTHSELVLQLCFLFSTAENSEGKRKRGGGWGGQSRITGPTKKGVGHIKTKTRSRDKKINP